jgi:hypothetical protein
MGTAAFINRVRLELVPTNASLQVQLLDVGVSSDRQSHQAILRRNEIFVETPHEMKRESVGAYVHCRSQHEKREVKSVFAKPIGSK